MASVAMTSAQGYILRLLAVDGDRVQLHSPQAAAPGSRLVARSSGGYEVRVKVFRCIRDGDQFEISGRLIDATRELRARLRAELEA
jgi:SOS-response transcriptional repressor LexA